MLKKLQLGFPIRIGIVGVRISNTIQWNIRIVRIVRIVRISGHFYIKIIIFTNIWPFSRKNHHCLTFFSNFRLEKSSKKALKKLISRNILIFILFFINSNYLGHFWQMFHQFYKGNQFKGKWTIRSLSSKHLCKTITLWK